MKRISLNIKTIGATLFLLLFITASSTNLFSQENKDKTKKEHVKIITLKITEDENGEVKTIDTTMIFEGDELKIKGSGEEIMIWMDDVHNMHKLHSHDSMMFMLNEYNVMKCDSLMKIMVTVDSEDEDMLINIMDDGEKYFYEYKIDSDIDGDSINMIISKHMSDLDFKDIDKHIMKFSGDDDSHFIFIGEDNDVKVTAKDGTKVYKIKIMGHDRMGVMQDTIIEDDVHKIIIKTNVSPDGNEEKTVTVFTTTETVGSDLEKVITKEITVEVDGDNVNVWTTDEGDSYKVVTKTIILELLDPKKKELKDLKKAGVNTKKRELEIDDLRFSPNPSDGKITLSFTLEEKKTVIINIYDINGNIVYTETIKDFQGTYNKEIDISDKGTGAFFLQIIQGLYDVIKKIIIQ